jgi:hypothetical protein
VVTDPARGLLLRVDPQTLETVGEVPLGGTPSDVVLVAAEGETH